MYKQVTISGVGHPSLELNVSLRATRCGPATFRAVPNQHKKSKKKIKRIATSLSIGLMENCSFAPIVHVNGRHRFVLASKSFTTIAFSTRKQINFSNWLNAWNNALHAIWCHFFSCLDRDAKIGFYTHTFSHTHTHLHITQHRHNQSLTHPQNTIEFKSNAIPGLFSSIHPIICMLNHSLHFLKLIALWMRLHAFGLCRIDCLFFRIACKFIVMIKALIATCQIAICSISISTPACAANLLVLLPHLRRHHTVKARLNI